MDMLNIILMMNQRIAGAHRETVHPTSFGLRCRFSIEGSVPRAGCDHPVTTTGVALQTPHKLMRIASTARHCLRIANDVKHIFSQAHFVGAHPLAKIIARRSARMVLRIPLRTCSTN
jgi:hypothetical protein